MEGRSRNALPHKGKALLVVHNRFYIGATQTEVLCFALQQLKDLKI